ncbi:MAG: flagellar export chaperone FlgN [Magnetococcales bacterium]|nr:flagellar export chaperone FlgN [Magnetococcales bacterium]
MTTSDHQQELALLKRQLEGMIRQFKDLANLLLQERQFVKERKTAELETISRLIHLSLEGIHDSEESRLALIQRLAAKNGLTSPTVSLADLDKAMGGDSGLLPLRDELKKTILQTDKLNKENQAIIKGVEQATEAILAIFKKSAQTGESYNRLGGRRAGSALNLYSRKL